MGFFGDVKQAVNELVEGSGEEAAEPEKTVEEVNFEQPEELSDDILNFDSDELKMLDAALEAGFEEPETAAERIPESSSEVLTETQPELQNAAETAQTDIDIQKMLEETLAQDVPLYGDIKVPEEAEENLNSENHPNEADASMAEETDFSNINIQNVVQEQVIDIAEKPASKGVKRRMENGERVISDETSVITPGMTVTGSIEAEGSLSILGTVKGNVDVSGKLEVTGHITGDLNSHEFFAENAKITGNITSDTSVKVGAGTVIVGNIVANSAAIAGAIKGDIDVHGPVIIDSGAIVMGNIKSKTVQINNGAAVEGNCSQCYADKNPTSFFNDYTQD